MWGRRAWVGDVTDVQGFLGFLTKSFGGASRRETGAKLALSTVPERQDRKLGGIFLQVLPLQRSVQATEQEGRIGRDPVSEPSGMERGGAWCKGRSKLEVVRDRELAARVKLDSGDPACLGARPG